MGLTKQEAYRILELPPDPSADDIRSSYKKLALKWHPDKHATTEGQEEATKKFQQVSAAYKRLTNEQSDDDEVYMTTSDMFDLFAHIFFHANVGRFCNCGNHSHYSYDSDDSSYSDESDDDAYERFERARYARRSDDFYKRPHNLSEAEANKNAQELIQQEEKEKKKAEKKRAKKKRNKERKKQKEREKKVSESNQTEEKENTQKNSNTGPKEEIDKSNLSETKKDKNVSKKQNSINKTTSKTTNNPSEKDKKIQDSVSSKTLSSNITQHSKSSENMDSKNINGISSTKSKTKEDSSSNEEEDLRWDTSSAFFARVASKGPSAQTSINSKSTPTVKTNLNSTNIINSKTWKVPLENGKSESKKDTDPQPQVQIDPVVLKSRQIAVKGNEMANENNYQKAVELFTQAIALDSRDCRFFGNRSYCYDRLTQYEKALQDADSAIKLAPEWPKGYFRRGRALAGLKLYADAESSFAQVLKLDKHCEDAMFELDRVRVAQLVEMGFPAMQSQIAIEKFGTVQAALEALLAGKVKVPDVCEEVYRSDEDEDEIAASSEAARISGNTSFQNYNHASTPVNTQNGIHKSSLECSSLWIGNVNPEEVTERNIRQIFSRFGHLDSVRMLPNRYCAFVNYDNPESAAQALKAVQGYKIGGQELLLRYPNNSSISNLPPTFNSVIFESEQIQQDYKLTGPVNGDECYFWRTSGCFFGAKCRYRHLPESRAADLGKVREKYGGKLRTKTPTQVIRDGNEDYE